jgi:hypothetical protein
MENSTEAGIAHADAGVIITAFITLLMRHLACAE